MRRSYNCLPLQVSPEYPVAHVHVYPPDPSEPHAPPFRQGVESHGLAKMNYKLESVGQSSDRKRGHTSI